MRQTIFAISRAIFVLCGLLLSSCAEPPVSDGKRFVPFGERCYRIPVWNAQPINASPIWPGFRRRESNRAMTLRFANTELAGRFAGYSVPRMETGDPQRGMLVGLFLPTEEDTAQIATNKRLSHYDIWYGLGDYSSRTIEANADTGLYRVSPLPNGNSWMVVTRVPDEERRDTHLDDNFWIATCHIAGLRRERSCTVHLFVAPLYVTLHTIEENLPLREQIARYVAQTLESWEVACE